MYTYVVIVVINKLLLIIDIFNSIHACIHTPHTFIYTHTHVYIRRHHRHPQIPPRHRRIRFLLACTAPFFLIFQEHTHIVYVPA